MRTTSCGDLTLKAPPLLPISRSGDEVSAGFLPRRATGTTRAAWATPGQLLSFGSRLGAKSRRLDRAARDREGPSSTAAPPSAQPMAARRTIAALAAYTALAAVGITSDVAAAGGA